MFPLGFLIFPYLVIQILKIYKKNFIINYFICGLFFSLGFFCIFLFWIINPFLVYEDTKPFAILAIFLPILLSILFAFFFIIYKFFSNKYTIIIVTPFIFLLIEIFISNFLYGFPWFTFSLVLSNNILGLYIIKYFGTFASGFLLIFFFLLPNFLTTIYKNKSTNLLFFFIFIPFLLILITPTKYFFLNNNHVTKEIKIEVNQILSPLKAIEQNKIQQNIINIIKASESEYVIFAENNYPYIINDVILDNLNKNLDNKKKVIIGATRFEENKFFNSFLLLEKNNIQYFDKKILVPFGEFLPLRKYLKFFEPISGTKDFEVGNNSRILIDKSNLSIFPVICYEIIFDKIFKNINNYNIDILVNITNDSWFGYKLGPYQHFYISRIKTVIANKPLVRVSNNGISAIIDSNGTILKSTPLNKKAKINYELEINNLPSYYLIHVYLLIYLIIMFIILISLRVFLKKL